MKYSPFKMVCFSVLLLFSFGCKKTPAQPSPNPAAKSRVFYNWTSFVMGTDLSYVNQVQDYGGVYNDSGIVKDPFTVFKNHGANVVRVRLWHNPQWLAALNSGKLYSNLYDVEKTIQRAKSTGMAVSLDLHYSDTWADPDKQTTPAAWNGLSLAVLKDSVYNYTTAVLDYLKSKNLTPEMIQVGNETNQGMLWPVGKVTGGNFTGFCELLKSGIKAVRDFSAGSAIKPQIILHVAQMQNAAYWANGIIGGGVTDFDILGLSHYSKWSTIATMAQVTSSISAFKAAYGKKIMIVETSYPFSTGGADGYANIISGDTPLPGYPVTQDGQYQYMKDLTQAVISGGGSGIMYWEPAWITSSLRDLWGTGSSWENNTLFDFNGNNLPAMEYMTFPYQF